MREVAELFGKQLNAKVEVVTGPTNQWIEKAKKDADIIYSGAYSTLRRAPPRD
jgi:accessory colonization factor AcfC